MFRQVQVKGSALNVLDVGSGPVLLFVHGFPLDHSMWLEQVDHFQQTHRVLVPDLRGFGHSSPVAPEAISMAEYAADLSELLTQLEITEPVTLCGLSMGGYIAIQFALHYQNRLNVLVLCDTKATADLEDAQLARFTVAQRVMEEGTGFLARTMPEKLFAQETFVSNSTIIEATETVIQQTSPAAISAASLGMGLRPDTMDKLPRLTLPTLVIAGAHDGITPPAVMQKMAGQLPVSKFVTIPHAGHMAPLEAPQVFNRELTTFLNSITVS